MRMQEKGVPTVEEYLEEKLRTGEVLGFDGNCVSAKQGEKLEQICRKKQAEIRCERDLPDIAWPDRPALPCGKVWELSEEYAGESCQDKLREVRSVLEKEGVDCLFLSGLDDIMWLFNLRGGDIECNPVQGSYIDMIIQKLENGEQVERSYVVEENIFTKDNVGRFLEDRTY